MKSLRLLDRRAGFSLGAVVMLFGMVAPAVIPAFASASELTSRSITVSSSNPSATSVSYELQFTPSNTSATNMVVYFCSNDPVEGDSCTAPTGMSLSSATVSGEGATIDSSDSGNPGGTDANAIAVKGLSLVSGNNTITISGVTNPSGANSTYYARIETFANDSAQEAVWSYTTSGAVNGDTDTTGIQDYGGLALSTTNNIGVTAYVEESMTFCVASNAPTAGCGGTLNSPSVKLGSAVGNQTVLSNTLSTATDYAQISTNAVDGAVVNLKSDATSCGGLYLAAQTSTCGIAPQTSTGTGIATGAGLFGLTVGAEQGASGGGTPTGTVNAATGYDASHYYINYASGNGSGVTSTYGSSLFNTNSQPISNENVPIGFGADTSNTTPAGEYEANLSLIAVGTF